LFALALDLPEDFFADKITKPAAIMRLLYYPPQTGIVDDRTIGIGSHTDYECFTILWQQGDINALQVLNTAGKWISAVPIPGSLVVNLGDQFARWTSAFLGLGCPCHSDESHAKTMYSGLPCTALQIAPVLHAIRFHCSSAQITMCHSRRCPAAFQMTFLPNTRL